MRRRVIATDAFMATVLTKKDGDPVTIRVPAYLPGRLAIPTRWTHLKSGALLWLGEGFYVHKITPEYVEGTYKADGKAWVYRGGRLSPIFEVLRKRPCHAMPQELSRFTLEVTDTRVELDAVVLQCRLLEGSIAAVLKRREEEAA